MITGRPEQRDGQDHLVLDRTFAAPIEDVWAALTESERLGRWFCTWTGDPETGRVEVTWAFEDDAPVETYVIEECAAPHHLRVRNLHDDAGQVWILDARLREEGDRTVLTFAQALTGDHPVSDVGPGWEFYLDRLVDSVRTGQVSSLEWSGYEAMSAEYAAAFGGAAKA
ncbi:SRPBCC domain-containing protein [Ornithinimicrobium cryptoxanthini]|uniref:SRPBCC domain-containing protein n=1 Tax=Ornithinimicrobium cryptoxanthini TaxID=2934161 RepID=A0ABY4YI40_9MICO|nr:SRPBCC domain-containing protein [Ornithinimicrobium cryptoxanthini]USQ76279.1 SRPBCC domain-containing protein [Ornithinimicrobium cryptoxanthini]